MHRIGSLGHGRDSGCRLAVVCWTDANEFEAGEPTGAGTIHQAGANGRDATRVSARNLRSSSHHEVRDGEYHRQGDSATTVAKSLRKRFAFSARWRSAGRVDTLDSAGLGDRNHGPTHGPPHTLPSNGKEGAVTMPFNSADERPTATLVLEPGTLVLEPGVLVLEPGILVLEPGILVLEPGILVLEPGILVLEPGTQVRRPAKDAFEPGANVSRTGHHVDRRRRVGCVQCRTRRVSVEAQRSRGCKLS